MPAPLWKAVAAPARSRPAGCTPGWCFEHFSASQLPLGVASRKTTPMSCTRVAGLKRRYQRPA